MALFPLSFSGFFGGPPPTEDENGCWIGLPSPFETRLLRPLSTYAIDQLRARLLFVVVDDHDAVKGARALLQMVCEAELKAVLVKVMTLTNDVLTSKVCGRRKFVEVDADMRSHGYLVAPAVAELKALPDMPRPYVDLVTRYLKSHYPKYRVAAMAMVVCLAAAVSP